jgi:hypothetical protein
LCTDSFTRLAIKVGSESKDKTTATRIGQGRHIPAAQPSYTLM